MIGREDELHGEDMSLLIVSNTALVMEKLERHEVVTISGRSKRIGMS